MSCSGLHCASCSGGAGVPVAALLCLEGAAWIAAHVVEVAAVAAACGMLAVAAVVALMRHQERREAVRAAMGPLMVTRVDAAPLPQVTRGTPPAIEQHVHHEVHYHLGDRSSAELAALIRVVPEQPSLEGRA